MKATALLRNTCKTGRVRIAARALLAVAVLSTTLTARADFSYTTTRKTIGGHSVAGDVYQFSKHYFKGRKMKIDTGDIATILDFDAQTITTIDNKLKTISVRPLSDVAAVAKQNDVAVNTDPAKIDVKETGQRKAIKGFEAGETFLTTDIDSPELRLTGRRMQMEMDVWVSAEVPGAGEVRKFYQKNMGQFPWAALTGGGDRAIQVGLANLQRKIAGMNGVAVLEVVKVRSANGGPGARVPQLNSAQSAQMREAMAQLDVIRDKGGQEGVAAGQAIARMSAMTGGPPPGSLFEITIESADFSTGSIPDSVFAIPAGYQKVNQK